ncbi:unnamed protein product [Bemisia tabaci]|uniref:RRM domain-containing protein n=1 Tax=Bemisia tabaci TaxID=7038 RepID=A0A9P0AG48_BEMTA|nr:PREDICTED: THO complex subunit 4 [Bemisia tabaci]XP_018907527.1 PREDICTED: THO complex subunit 4 [Bemisia tabaci]CAH0390463.1 unnamed protein product [Bemisia tabaci]
MVDKIDLSLDDIINQNKSLKNWRGGRGRRGVGGNRRGRGSPRGRVNKRSIDRPVGSGGRGLLKSRRGSARGLGRSPYSRGDVNNQWKHDLYDGGRMGNRNRISASAISNAMQPGKLLISNLDFAVSNADIEELFAEYGNLKSAKVHYDKSGRSLGTADIVFERKADAVKAMKQYNGVPLDGRPMSIQLATSDLSLVSPVRRPTVSSRPASRGGNIQRGRPNVRRGSAGFRRGGGGGGRGGNRKKDPPATAEQLDAELDAYVNKMEE